MRWKKRHDMSVQDYFARTRTITITTTTRDGRAISTPIWSVVVDDVPYIRSGYGETSAWYRRLRRTWQASFGGRGTRYEARVEPVADEATRAAVDVAYKVKYQGQGTALRQAIESPARDYTLRIIAES